MSGASTDSTSAAAAAAATRADSNPSANTDGAASFDGDMSAFGLPANFGGAAFSSSSSTGPGEGRGRGRGRGHARARGSSRGGREGNGAAPRSGLVGGTAVGSAETASVPVPTGPRSQLEAASHAPPQESGGFRGGRGRGFSHSSSEASGRGRGVAGVGGPRGRGRGGGRGGFGGPGLGQGNGYGYTQAERAPQAFFKPSFLEDPWAHLTSKKVTA